MDMENIFGLKVENIVDFGRIIVCMEKENMFGKMEECMKENI